MSTPSFEHRYMFSVKAPLSSYKLGNSPQGCRIDVAYERGDVTTDPDLFFASWQNELRATAEAIREPLPEDGAARRDWLAARRAAKDESAKPPWLGMEGQLISGSDWLLVRVDGAAELNSRTTIREDEWTSDEGLALGGSLINLDLSTVVDVGTAVPAVADERVAPPLGIDQPRPADTSKGSYVLFFTAAIRLTTAHSSEAWAEERYRSEQFWRFQRLPVHQYFANARVAMESGLFTAIEFDVWRVRFKAGPEAACGAGGRS